MRTAIRRLVVLEEGKATLCVASAAAASRMRAQPSASRRELPLATAFSATWEGAAALPTLAYGSYLDPASGEVDPASGEQSRTGAATTC